MTNQTFGELPADFSFVDNELALLKWWQEADIVAKYLHKNDQSEKVYSFLDGPITANNPMGVHHAWGRALKDLYQRYKNMQGYRQRFQNGFDCQGLWVEVEVEKEKGFKNKKDIENYGIDKFVEDCKSRVLKYSAIQTQQSIRLGYFMDWDHSYFTMSDENNYMIWAFLKKCHEEGNIYQGEDVVPWCPRCGTAISQHEIDTEGYKQLTHDSVYMRFPVIKKGQVSTNEFLLVWTTTPWTIPADTLVAVSPEIEYAQVEFEGNRYWLAKNLIKASFDQDIKPIKVLNGQQLIEDEGVEFYQAAFDTLPIIKDIAIASPHHFHAVVLSKDLVNDQEGTGLVHIVPGTGKEDFDLVKSDLKWDDVIFPAVDEAGLYIEGYGALTGQSAKNHPELILDELKKIEDGRYLFKIKKYLHAYPVCWRCSSELIWRIVKEWYIAMDHPRPSDHKSLRERMLAVAQKITWIPDFGLKRELDWLNNMHDWLISKKRYWGLSLPIWVCANGHFEVVGSQDELKSKATEGWDKFSGHTPHRPWIDNVKIKCPHCQELMTRIPDVGNPWLDAGIVPFSTLIDPETKKLSYLTDKKYFKTWFPADFITESFPGQFKNWFYSLIAMSSVLEDTNAFKTILGYATVKDEKGEEMHKSKGNAIWFDDAAQKIGVDTMRWFYCRQNPEFNLLFGYKNAEEVRRQFILLYWNTVKYFLTYAKVKQWQPTADITTSTNVLDRWIISLLESTKSGVEQYLDRYEHQNALNLLETFIENLSQWYIRRSRDRDDILPTLYTCLDTLTLELAPIIPFLTETIFQVLHPNSQSSVHLQTWPTSNPGLIDTQLQEQMVLARNFCQLIHGQRQLAAIKIRQPLSKVTIKTAAPITSPELIELIKDETNVKDVLWEKGTNIPEVILDTLITPELKEEGEYRDFVRSIQVMRKEQGFELHQKIRIMAPTWPLNYEQAILDKTLAVSIEKSDKLTIVNAN